MKYLYALLCVFVSITCLGQEARLYKSIRDYQAERAETELVRIRNMVFMNTGFGRELNNDFEVSSKQQETQKFLDLICWGVERNDSLFLNTNIIRDSVQTVYTNAYEILSKGYTYVLFRSEKYMCFQMKLGGRKKGRNSAFAADYNSGLHPGRVDCVLDITTNKVYILNRYIVEGFLEAKPELLKQYIDAGSPETMDTYIIVFKQLS